MDVWGDYVRLCLRHNDLILECEKLRVAMEAYHKAVQAGVCADPALYAWAEIAYKEAQDGRRVAD
jgi:hypothetical protein